MKQRFGGLLSLVLGMVLIVGGGLGVNNATGGNQQPTCQPEQGGVFFPCPTGKITITKKMVNPPANPPASWQVTVTSPAGSGHCTTSSGAELNETVSVKTNGTASSQALFVYTSPLHTQKCGYQLVETNVAGYTASFNPASPITLPFSNKSGTGNDQAVTLTNTYKAPSSSAASSAAPTAVARASTAPLANTGTHTQISWSLFAGIALCLLGLVLLFAGRLPLRGARRG